MKIVVSSETLMGLMPKLLEGSIPFEVKPLPDDFYQLSSGYDAGLKRLVGENETWTVVTYDALKQTHGCFNPQALNVEDAEKHAILMHLDEHVEDDLWADYLEQGYVWTVYVFKGQHAPAN